MINHFGSVSKEKLQEYQKLAVAVKKDRFVERYKDAYSIWSKWKDIKEVELFFNVSKETAYRMVRKGRSIIEGVHE